ncbi:MAG: hypothetical protein EPO32_07795 [Anaerolineae bacterium]|nr:MAG: hypothetical protein EPO32_07795 [Anaerolineae bacterium]
MTLPSLFADPTYRIYSALAQYPVLATRIRARMRQELFDRGLLSPNQFKEMVREQSIQSQGREGLTDPFAEEPEDVWRERQDRVRDTLTDLHFANNFGFELFEEIVRQVLAERGARSEGWLIDLNAELAPQELLVEQALAISAMPPAERARYEPRLQEIKVVLIRSMISDQLAYIKIAKKWFTIHDLLDIRERKTGKGKVGGKAAGMLLARRILLEMADEDVKASVRIPESFFLAADVMYTYMAYNDLMHWAEQKYKPAEQIRSEYLQIQKEYLAGRFPPDIQDNLHNILQKIGSKPLIVRSSSLLEDNFGTSFAGKYDSVFCPNQGTPEENFEDFTTAIAAVYASALKPDALLYRRRNDLIDYDERIAILIQEVEGDPIGDYYFPQAAGVAFSRNLYRWSPQIERDAGFLRLVWGLGTRAVDRVGNDYPRMVALSHPLLHSHAEPRAIVGYSQKYLDVIDLKANKFRSIPAQDVIDPHYPILRYIAQVYQDGYLSTIRSNLVKDRHGDVVITFDEMLRRTPFADRMRRMLNFLEQHYESPVDMEFTARILNPSTTTPDVQITILQCRPQSQLQESIARVPPDLKKERIIFSTKRVLLYGRVPDIRYVMFVSPEGYFTLPTPSARHRLSRAISRLNAKLEGARYIAVGPGRWGTTNPDLGVRIGYGDIFHTRALVELSGAGVGTAPEPSFGTHFFQDLIESQIFPLAIYLDDPDAVFRRNFFYKTPNRLLDFLPDEGELVNCLHLIDVQDYKPGYTLDLVMDGEDGRAVAFLVPPPPSPVVEET